MSLFHYGFAALMSLGSNFFIGIRDILDVLFMAVLLYAGFRLLKETHSAPMVAGVLSLAGFYGLVRTLDLPVTSLVLQSFFEIFLIIIALIFQRELRRFFSLFGLLGLRRRQNTPSERTIAIVSRAVVEFMRQKKGALIVFPGREDIERFEESGSELHGVISEPILMSIFDETSPGHDGAVIIENNLIKKFAVHLPLAEHIEKTRQFGLRHRAALGLSERSDAFVIVVSEEKGTARVALGGSFETVYDERDLAQRLAAFYDQKFPQRSFEALGEWSKRNGGLAAAGFITAAIIWFVANPQLALVQRTFSVTPEFAEVPAGIVITSVKPQEVRLVVQGRSADFDAFNESDVRLVVPLDKASTGTQRIVLDPSDIALPGSFSVIKIDPTTITVQTGSQ